MTLETETRILGNRNMLMSYDQLLHLIIVLKQSVFHWQLHFGHIEVSNKSATPYRIPGAIDMRKVTGLRVHYNCVILGLKD